MPKKVFNSTNRGNDFRFALVSQCLITESLLQHIKKFPEVVSSSDYIVLYWFIDMPIRDSSS